MYFEGYFYFWMIIGYVEDLDRVNVNDLKVFFKCWYGLNNVVFIIGGDIDVVKIKVWIEKYFGEIFCGLVVEEFEF